jgi:hypothetical protein
MYLVLIQIFIKETVEIKKKKGTKISLGMGSVTTGIRIPDPPFSSFGPSRDYGMDLCLEVYL